MKIKIGDTVRFLDSVGGGVVTKIEKDTAFVLSDDGFEYPSLIGELIKIESSSPSDERQESVAQVFNKEIVPQVEEPENEGTQEDIIEGNDILRLFVGFVPQNEHDPTNCDLDLYLINDSNFHVFYTYLLPDSGNTFEYKKSGKLDPNTKWKIDTLERNEVGRLGEMLFQALAYSRSTYEPVQPLHKLVRLQTVWFFKHAKYKTNDFFHEDAIIYEVTDDPLKKAVEKITEDDVKKIVKQQEHDNKTVDKSLISKQKKERFFEEKVVDLHIHELIDDENGLANHEILQIQMDKFEEELNATAKTPTKRIVFIHGVGNGRLKLDLRKKLDRKYQKFRYQDASFAEYGWGATLVFLK